MGAMKRSRLLGTAIVSIFTFVSMSSQATPVSGQGTWESTLIGRDLDGDLGTAEAYYDTLLDITWLADVNTGAGTIYDDGGLTTDGRMSWLNASA
jgi:hypothetical protein